MKRSVVLTGLLLLTSSMPLAAAGALQVEAGAGGVTPTRQATLYDQTDSAAGNGAPDQDFEPAFDLYDTRGADDFEVPSGFWWDITQVQTVGTTGTPGGATVNVWFYEDAAGMPGPQVCAYTGLTPTDINGSLTIDLPTACRTEGRTWLAIQVRQDWGTVGQHFWSNRTTQSYSPSQWENPGDAFGTGCTTWGNQAGTLDGNPATGCGVGGGTNPDFLFALVGNQVAQEIGVPILGRAGALAMVLLLIAGGAALLWRRT